MRFAEKAKRFVSISMIVCMFVLAFGIMTAYAYSYVKFGDGWELFGGSYDSYANVTIKKVWRDSLGEGKHSKVVVNYKVGDGETQSVILDENSNGLVSDEIKVPTKGEDVIFSISEEQVPGYAVTYEVNCKKDYYLSNVGAGSDSSDSGDSDPSQGTQLSEGETTSGSDDNQNVSEAESENSEANESEPGTEEVNDSESRAEEMNESASDDSNLSESDPEEESDGNTQTGDTEKESEPSEEEFDSDAAEEETQKNSSLTEEDETVTYKKESVLSFGGLSIVSMNVDTGSGSSNGSTPPSDSSISSDSDSGSDDSSDSGAPNDNGSSDSNISSDSGGSNDSSNTETDNSNSNESSSSGGGSNEGSNNSDETGSNVSDEGDNESSNENNDTTADGNGNETSDKNETVDTPNHAENPDNSGEDSTQDGNTSDKANDENSGTVSNQEDEAANSQTPANDKLSSVTDSQRVFGRSGSGGGGSKDGTKEEDDELDGDLEVEMLLTANANTEKRGSLFVELDDETLKKIDSYKKFDVQLKLNDEEIDSKIDLLDEEKYTWEDLLLYDESVGEYEYTLETEFTFSVQADEPFILPDDSVVEITVTNTSVNTLEISKKVAGSAADTNQEFSFTITFEGNGEDPEKSYNYSGSKEGAIRSGETITLKHDDSIYFNDLPEGTKWTVAEAETDYNTEVKIGDEVVKGNVANGIIGGLPSVVQFINTKNGGGDNGGGGGNSGGGGGGGGGRSGGSTPTPDPEPQPEEFIELPEEEVPLAAFTPELPKTGDDSRTVLYLVLCLASLGSAVLLTISLRKRNGR